jgi:hypothetical protein
MEKRKEKTEEKTYIDPGSAQIYRTHEPGEEQ